MSDGAITFGVISLPLRWLWRAITLPVRYAAGTSSLEVRLSNIETHVYAMTDVLHLLVADASGKWTPEQRERVQRAISNFTLVRQGLAGLQTSGNPVSQEAIERLREYLDRAERGETFTVAEAREFKEISERVAREHVGEDWVADLLKLALFLFGLYVVGEMLKPSAPPGSTGNLR